MAALLPMPFSNPTTYAGHSGVDFPKPAGTPIPASGDGVVYHRNVTKNGGYQIWVRYDLNGAEVGYAHMPSHAACPPVGTRVHAGTKLGVVGTTGRSTGPHLHAEINGDATTAGFWRKFDQGRVVGASHAQPGGFSQEVANQQAWMNSARGEKLAVDGVRGPATIAAIKRYQAFLGVTADGVWGARTQAAHAVYYAKVTAPAAPAGSDLIRSVQAKLKANYPLYAGKLAVDGIQGPATTAALKEFQRRSGLTVDGIVGPRTRAKLGV